MKPKQRKRQAAPDEPVSLAPTTIFSSDLLTPEEERELLAGFWENKSELVRVLVRSFPRLRQHRPPLEIAVARQSHLVSLSPHHLQELGLLQQESEALAHGGKHLPSPQELASRTGSSLEHLTHLQTATRTPVSLNAVLDDDSDFKLTEAMPDNDSTTLRQNSERQEAIHFLMENLRPRERKVLDLRFGLTGNGTHSLRQIGHLLRISKERVRQIQNRALEKLRASAERVGWEPSLLLG